jgi:hypothetical protein
MPVGCKKPEHVHSSCFTIVEIEQTAESFTATIAYVIQVTDHLLHERDVLVRSVRAVGHSRFMSIIYGFEPSYELDYQGLNLGDEVEFEEKHIIACSEE